MISKLGAPHKLLSDDGTNFMSDLVQEVYKLFDIKKLNIAGYHPHTSVECLIIL